MMEKSMEIRLKCWVIYEKKSNEVNLVSADLPAGNERITSTVKAAANSIWAI